MPTPLNVLRGGIDIGLDGNLALSPVAGDVKLTLKSDLASHDQDLDMKAGAQIHFVPCVAPENNAQIAMNLSLDKMKIRLPNHRLQKSTGIGSRLTLRGWHRAGGQKRLPHFL